MTEPETSALPDPAPGAIVRLPVTRRRKKTRRLLRSLLLAGAALSLLGGGVLLAWTWELPAFDTLQDYDPLVSTRVYGADGSEVFQFARERRTVVTLDEIPEVLRKAVLAAEDARFYEHEGVNVLAIARCAVKGVLRGGIACGGSTITQQVVKTFLLSTEWKPKRKVKELVLAPRLEEKLSKDEILYLYLNQIYLGHLRYGVEEASRFYFGKGVSEVDLGEAAVLAGIVQSPMRLSPVNHPARAKERQKYVLRRMLEEGLITKAEHDREVARPIAVRPPEPDPPGAWYADAVRRHLDGRYGAETVETRGLRVEVAMDPSMQRYAEAALEAGLRAVDRRQGFRGPILHLEPDKVAVALPLWRDRLARADARRGEVLVWDLSRVNPREIDPEEAEETGVARMARPRPLETGEVYAGLVAEAGEKSATVDLGGAKGTLSLPDVLWARKWNPTSATATPKAVSSVVRPGDVVLVRVMPGRLAPERAAREGKPLVLSLEQTPLVQGALVAIDPATRGVRALVGGYDFAASQFNRAIQARRQPGSAFKPFVWGAAVESRRFTPATVVYDTPDLYRDPWTGKEWRPRNYEKDSFDGPMLLSAALAQSKNTVSVKLTDALGPDAVIDFARRMGIGTDLPRNLTLALGTGEVLPIDLVNAYASIAARGFHAPPVLVVKVTDRDGTVLEEAPLLPVPGVAADGSALPAADPGATPAAGAAAAAPPSLPGEPVPAAPPLEPPPFPIPASGTRPDVACVLSSMMRGVVEEGTGAAAKALGRPAAAKTGTAQEHRDAWFVGFTPELVGGVWIGFDDHSPLGPRETGAGAALPAWLSFMQAALGTRPPVPFEVVPGVELTRIDPATGLLADRRDDVPFVAFLAGTAPEEGTDDRRGSAPQNFFMEDR